jgi:hypothetical protein
MAKKKDMKKLTIFARGQGKRRVIANYLIESPVWKTSYRILLPENDLKKPLLQVLHTSFPVSGFVVCVFDVRLGDRAGQWWITLRTRTGRMWP